MDQQTLEALEYNRIVEVLSGLAATSCGKSLCLSVKPSVSLKGINESLLDTYEMQEILNLYQDIPLSGIADLRPYLKRVSTDGAYLSPEEFLDIRSTLDAIHRIKDFFSPLSSKYPRASSRAASLSLYVDLLNDIDRTFDEKGFIKDTASSELSWIRKEISETRNRVRNVLNEILRKQDLKTAFQDDFITIRDDRFVLALKADFKGAVKGIIHGESNTGETYFIEPLQTVELNNNLTTLARDEKEEEIKILKKLSVAVRERQTDIEKDISGLADIDLIYAKAKLGIMLNSTMPVVGSGSGVHMINARHPLLALKGDAVPVDIHLDRDKNSFVISGANTGGKTVALKTIGLLTLMSQSGLTIPVSEETQINIFDNVIADIGDRQDIQLNLSTFSGHLKRLCEILNEAGNNTLVLIDEICDGTDPVEAGALSLAILEKLRMQRATTVVTTHLNTLKSFAYTNSDADNISVEFDEVSLKPTYRLIYGLPGRSCALTIAEKWGIKKDVIDRAKDYLKGTEGAGVEFITAIEQEKKMTVQERERYEELNREAAELNERRKKAINRFDKEMGAMLEREKKRAEEIIKKAADEIKRIIEDARAEEKSKIKELKQLKTETLAALMTDKKKSVHIPSVGDTISIMGQKNKGKVISTNQDSGEAEVLIGSIKIRISFDSIESAAGDIRYEDSITPLSGVMGHGGHPIGAGTPLSGGKGQGINGSSDYEKIPGEINIIGLTIDEALPEVDKFIDNAVLNGINSVVIIHGAGTGRLRNAVQKYLEGNKAVKGFYYADQKSGGTGATIVELK